MEELLKGGFAEIKSILHQELKGVNITDKGSKSRADQATGLVENTSIRELLEKISFKLDSLELGKSKIMSGSSSGTDEVGSHSSKFSFMKTLIPTGKDIRALTDSQEQAILHDEMRFGLDEVDLEIAQDEMEMFMDRVDAHEFPVFLTVIIQNHLEVELTQPDVSLENCTLNSKPHFPPGTASLLTIFDPQNSSWLQGLLSFRIPGEDSRLLISFERGQFEHGGVCVIFVPDWFPTKIPSFPFDEYQGKIWEYMTSKRSFKWVQNPHSVVVRYGGIHVQVSSTGHSPADPNISISIRERPVVNDSIDGRDDIVVGDGKTVSGKTISNFFNYSLENYGYIVEISNCLNISLIYPKMYLENDEAKIVNPDLIAAATREVLIIKTNFYGNSNGGLVTYRIGNTDLRLVLAFQLFYTGNKFAVAFIQSSIPVDRELMKFLTNPNSLNTCLDHQYGGAKDGKQMIETRNIRACASMTEGIKTHLKVVVATF